MPATQRTDLDIDGLITILEECLSLLNKARETTAEQDKWLYVHEVHFAVFEVVVKNTSLDLFNFNKVIELYEISRFSLDEWLNLVEGYTKTFLTNAQKEKQLYY